MFNPKSNNLLDEQLAVSGLEMNWVFLRRISSPRRCFGSSDRR